MPNPFIQIMDYRMNKEQFKSVEVELKVPFHDLDSMAIVWHGNYLKYFDIARFALFESVGIDLNGYLIEHQYVFPVSKSSAKHIFPLRHNDEFICRAMVTEASYKIAMGFEIKLKKDNKLCAKGKGEQVAVKVPEMEIQYKVPKEITQALERL